MKSSGLRGKTLIRGLSGVPGLPEPAAWVYTQAAGTLLLVHTLATLILQVLPAMWPGLKHWLADSSLAGFVMHAALMQGGLILLPTLLVIFFYQLPANELVGERIRPGSLLLAIIVGIPAAVVFQGLNNLLVYVLIRNGWNLPAPNTPTGSYGSSLASASLPMIGIIILVSVLLPAVVEELMFRGVLQSSLGSRGSLQSALIWQALAFALFHSDPLFILPPLLAGLLLGYLRLKSEHLLPPMLAHASLNASLLALNPLLPRLTAQYMSISTQTTTSILYASLIAACVAAVALVPLLVLISHLNPLEKQPVGDQQLYSGDIKYTLAMLILVVTMMVIYFQSTP
jgi:membrane protease YdiL (CAAX protease family)